MEKLKYKVGDKVRIKSSNWYVINKDADGFVHCGDRVFDNYMSVFCGSVVTIGGVIPYLGYDVREDMQCRTWTDEMIEGLAEEETKPKYEDESNGEYYSTPKYLVRPSGYQFVDENGNVINAQKIVLEKKKKEYPKTYEECSVINGCEDRIPLKIIGEFTRLINARNAYWKLYGEEMGLDKPWEPDWKNPDQLKYCIYCHKGEIAKDYWHCHGHILVFPTEEMRDAFYENFKKEIEICKELL